MEDENKTPLTEEEIQALSDNLYSGELRDLAHLKGVKCRYIKAEVEHVDKMPIPIDSLEKLTEENKKLKELNTELLKSNASLRRLLEGRGNNGRW